MFYECLISVKDFYNCVIPIYITSNTADFLADLKYEIPLFLNQWCKIFKTGTVYSRILKDEQSSAANIYLQA